MIRTWSEGCCRLAGWAIVVPSASYAVVVFGVVCLFEQSVADMTMTAEARRFLAGVDVAVVM